MVTHIPSIHQKLANCQSLVLSPKLFYLNANDLLPTTSNSIHIKQMTAISTPQFTIIILSKQVSHKNDLVYVPEHLHYSEMESKELNLLKFFFPQEVSNIIIKIIGLSIEYSEYFKLLHHQFQKKLQLE